MIDEQDSPDKTTIPRQPLLFSMHTLYAPLLPFTGGGLTGRKIVECSEYSEKTHYVRPTEKDTRLSTISRDPPPSSVRVRLNTRTQDHWACIAETFSECPLLSVAESAWQDWASQIEHLQVHTMHRGAQIDTNKYIQ